MDLEILQIASKNNNQKFLENHTHNSRLKNSLCGDEMQIKVIIKKDKNKKGTKNNFLFFIFFPRNKFLTYSRLISRIVTKIIRAINRLTPICIPYS